MSKKKTNKVETQSARQVETQSTRQADSKQTTNYPRIEYIPAYQPYRADSNTIAIRNADEETWAYIFCTLDIQYKEEARLDNTACVPYAIFDIEEGDIDFTKYIPEGETVILSNIPSGLYLWHDTDVEITRF